MKPNFRSLNRAVFWFFEVCSRDGANTMKGYSSRKRALEGELWQHEEIVLELLHPACEPIVLRYVEDDEFRVIAELVGGLG